MIIVMEECSDNVYIYLNPLGHTLKSFASIEYEFGIRSKGEGDFESGLGKSQNGSTISQMVPEGFKTLPMIYRRCRKVTGRSSVCFRKSGIFWKGKTVRRLFIR
jgi:hypothetical protein